MCPTRPVEVVLILIVSFALITNFQIRVEPSLSTFESLNPLYKLFALYDEVFIGWVQVKYGLHAIVNEPLFLLNFSLQLLDLTSACFSCLVYLEVKLIFLLLKEVHLYLQDISLVHDPSDFVLEIFEVPWKFLLVLLQLFNFVFEFVLHIFGVCDVRNWSVKQEQLLLEHPVLHRHKFQLLFETLIGVLKQVNLR